MKFVHIDSPCPMCRVTGGLSMLTTSLDIPYFGEGLETTLRCENCGFRHADFMMLGQKEPLRVTFRTQNEQDLSVRVIRSNSGTLRIPELGFLAEPTPLSESYVSNVEGVLERAKEVLFTAREFHGDTPEKRALLDEYLRRYETFLNGKAPFTLVIDDPYGNSAIVSEKVYDAFLDKLKAQVEQITVGDPAGYGTYLGPVVNQRARDTILGYIEKGKREGRLVAGGGAWGKEGYFIQPTVIADVKPDAAVAQEEIFGPVLAVIKAKGFDEALEVANGTEYGLTGAVYTKNPLKIERAKREFFVGNLYINRKCTGAIVGAHPFGGFNMSGTDSKAGGRDYLLLFLQAKSVAEKLE